MLNTHNPFLSPAQSDEFLPPISRWTSLGGLFLVATVAAAITLASVVKYNVTVQAAATVRPDGDIRIVQAQMEGTVKSIDVKENQSVKKGDAIARIDDSRQKTETSQLQGKIQQGKLQLAQIAAQIKALDIQILAESKSIERAIASAKAELSRNQRDYKEQLLKTAADLQEAEAALELATDEMGRYQQLVATGAVSQLQFKEKKSTVKSAAARLERAKAALNPSAATVAIASERIAQEQAKGEATLATLNRERFALIQRRVEIQNQLSHDLQELQQLENELPKSVIRATSDGIILKLNLRNPSQVVRKSEAIAKIAPDNAPLVVKATVETQDINKVAIGQKVQLRVMACPYPDYGTLKGVVSAISPDAVTPQGNSEGATTSVATAQAPGVSYFEATIQPESLLLANGNRQCRIQSGMEAKADIISKEETALQFLLRKARLITDL